MATRDVVLTDTQSDLVDRLVATGRYQNASKALRAGLRLLEREEAEFGDLRARLMEGLDQARRGDLAQGSGENAIRRAQPQREGDGDRMATPFAGPSPGSAPISVPGNAPMSASRRFWKVGGMANPSPREERSSIPAP